MYEKIRMNGRLVSMAVLIVPGVNRLGIREIMAVEPIHEESRDTYSVIFRRCRTGSKKKSGLLFTMPTLG